MELFLVLFLVHDHLNEMELFLVHDHLHEMEMFLVHDYLHEMELLWGKITYMKWNCL